MEKYCQKCGNRLGEGERFCGACGTPAGAAPPSVTQTQPSAPAQDQVQYAAPPQDYAQIMQPQAKKEKQKMSKKKKTWMIVGISAGAVAVLAAVFFIFILPLFGGKSTRLITFSRGGSDYYCSPYLVKLNGDKAPDLTVYQGGSSNSKGAAFHFSRSAMKGDSIYTLDSINFREKGLTRYDFSSDKTVSENQWVSVETLNASPFGKKDDAYPVWTTALYHLQIDGNYAYFTLSPQAEYAATQGDIRGKMGRIPLDGSKVEELSGINAADFAVDGGWIYYFDEGYQTTDDGKIGKRDASVAGIYKIKPDGSGKKQLHSFTVTAEQASEYNYGYGLTLCGDMQMIGGKLYFLDYSAEGMGRLARMGKDGGNIEYISTSAVLYYTVDGNTAYYGTTRFDGSNGYQGLTSVIEPTFAKCAIGSHQEVPISCPGMSMQAVSCHKGYLYFWSYNFSGIDGRQIGLRMNINTNQFEWLIYHDESTDEIETDPRTGRPTGMKHSEGARYLTWEAAETR